jgi:putative SOS response-associated peptidase YedK
MPIITQEEPAVISMGLWGLLPAFVKSETEAQEFVMKTLNAKSEIVFEKSSYKKNVLGQRCLVPVTGFFEWRDINKKKYPYFIGLKEEEIFSLGAIYNEWLNRNTGELIKTFSIITTPPNELMSRIHNLKQRMPLIFTRAEEERWLDQTLKAEHIREMMKPLDQELMRAHTIKKFSPRANNFNEELVEEFRYPELALYDC